MHLRKDHTNSYTADQVAYGIAVVNGIDDSIGGLLDRDFQGFGILAEGDADIRLLPGAGLGVHLPGVVHRTPRRGRPRR